jgi:hypothetical protein
LLGLSAYYRRAKSITLEIANKKQAIATMV